MLTGRMTASILKQRTRSYLSSSAAAANKTATSTATNKRSALRGGRTTAAVRPFSTASGASGSVEMPRWKQSVVTSDGNYAEEAWLEDVVGGPLYEHQASLPRLPVNSVRDTLQRLLPTALPLARNAAEEKALLDAADKFEQQAEQLQERLRDRAAEWSDSSWLQHWWNTMGYLQVRDPVVINVSYFFDFKDDSTATTNVQRGAALLYAAALFRRDICTGSKPADTVGRQKTVLCSVAYKYMFNSCRIPQPEQDSVKLYDPSLHPHAVVSRRGQFYAIDFVDRDTHRPLPIEVLEAGLAEIVRMADSSATSESYPELGWITSGNRDDCAEARAVLLESGGDAMARALETLESGAVLLCLDDGAPVSKSETALHHLHGTEIDGRNRWFDKSIQLNVAENCKAGLTGEHSMMDVSTLYNTIQRCCCFDQTAELLGYRILQFFTASSIL